MKRLFNLFKRCLTTPIEDLQLTFLHVFIIAISLIWAVILTLILPISFIASLTK